MSILGNLFGKRPTVSLNSVTFDASRYAEQGELLKEQLRAVLNGGGDGLDLDTPFHWIIAHLKQPDPFFEKLPMLLPSSSILYVEGTTIVPEVASLYSAHRVRNFVAVRPDTIYPVPDIYHIEFSPEVIARLRELARSRPVPELFDHLKAYKGESLLFTFHDAFEGCLRISERIPSATIMQFARALGVSCRREKTKPQDLEHLRLMLKTLESPEVIRVRRESTWRRLWRNWTGK
jgi:hypothetical protein